MRWYAGRRGNDQVAHYFAADRCVKEPVYLALESRRAVATARSAASRAITTARTVYTTLRATTRTLKTEPKPAGNLIDDICGYPGLAI